MDNNEAVLGELGWWKFETRVEFLMLKYWVKILLMDKNRLIRIVYNHSKEKYTKDGVENWCKKIHKLAIKYDLIELWRNEENIKITPPHTTQPTTNETNLRKRWYSFLYKKVHNK